MAKAGQQLARNVFGVVDGFDCVKHFGFIRYEGRTIYTNRKDIAESNLDEQGRRYLLRDQVVIFDLHEGPKDFMACNVRVMAEWTFEDVKILEKNVPGQIVSVKAEKKFCIIRTNCQEFETILGHFSNFKRTLDPPPEVGAGVLCDVGRNNAGKYVAKRIRVQSTKPAGGLSNASDLAGLQLIEEGVEGRVVSIKKDRGFGIIETDAFGTLLCHYTNVKTSESGFANLQLRQKVVCDVAEYRHKQNKVAINVRTFESDFANQELRSKVCVVPENRRGKTRKMINMTGPSGHQQDRFKKSKVAARECRPQTDATLTAKAQRYFSYEPLQKPAERSVTSIPSSTRKRKASSTVRHHYKLGQKMEFFLSAKKKCM